MENEKTKNPVGATIGETQNIIQIRASLEVMERNLPKEEALMLAKRIRPVMTRTANGKFKMLLVDKKLDGDKHWVDGGKIYNQSYTFNDLRQIYDKAENLTEVATINTYHRCGYPALLKPSVYEVLYQIPQDLLDKVVAFELFSPSNYMNDIYDSNIDRHRLVCVLYSGTMPKSVTDKEIVW